MESFYRQQRLTRHLLLAVCLCWLGLAAACRQDNPVTPTSPVKPVVTETPPTAGVTVTATAPSTTTASPAAESVATPSPEPAATPLAEPKNLVVCMSGEPSDLYLYGADMLVKQGVLHGIYENLITNLGYSYQAQGLQKLPSLEDGDAVLERTVVTVGERVINANGELVFLADGESIIDYTGEVVEFDGESSLMLQMQADFTFKPLVWEDGVPVTAADSVFSFEIASDPESRVSAYKLERTESYEAIDERTVRWTGAPGFIDREYFLNVWQPLPEHVLGGYSAGELAALEEAQGTPLANGPFRIEEWIPGERITLLPNEHYYRRQEGFPLLDQVTFRFMPDDDVERELLAGQCDIAYQDSLSEDNLESLEEAGTVDLAVLHTTSGTIMEHLDFAVQPSEAYAAGRPDWFGDVRVRQAVAQCIDREGLIDSVYVGYGETLDAYVPAGHPLYPTDGMTWRYNPEAGQALLEAAGFVDRDGDGVREAADDGTPFAIRLATTSGAELRPLVADLIASDLSYCGIDASVELMPADLFFSPGPDGVLFGRQFDLALFAWVVHTDPVCEIYEGRQIPGPIQEYPAGWAGNNVSGWQNDTFDLACEAALTSLPGSAEYAEAHQTALRIFMEEIPNLPLFMRLKIAATSPEVLNFRMDASEPSELWNLFELDIAGE